MKQISAVLVLIIVGGLYYISQKKNKSVDASDVPPAPIVFQASEPNPHHNKRRIPASVPLPQNSPSRAPASTVQVPIQSRERQLLVDLVKLARAANTNPAAGAKFRELKAKFDALPNRRQVLMDYYRDLQMLNGAPFDRVEALDMMNSRSGGDSQLAEVALAEALDFAPEKTIRQEDARNEQEMNVASSTDPSFIPVLVAYDIYLNNCGTYASCQQGLLTVIANNDNHNMKASLINAVYKRFPGSKDAFNGDLTRYHLN